MCVKVSLQLHGYSGKQRRSLKEDQGITAFVVDDVSFQLGREHLLRANAC